VQDAPPTIDSGFDPPLIKGAAILAHRAYATDGLDELIAYIDRPASTEAERAALKLDKAFAHQLRFRARQAAELQAEALGGERVFRVGERFAELGPAPLRLLAVMAPGDLMVNTPLDFITAHLDVRLDLMFVRPGQPLPERMPDHDVAFFAVSESDPATLRRLAPLFRVWPRPALNDPARVMRLTRDGVAAAFMDVPGVLAPRLVAVMRATLARMADGGPLPAGFAYPVLLRPLGAHAGRDLDLLDGPARLAEYLAATAGDSFFLSSFVDYRAPDALFHKYRIAFIAGRPFICHMAPSEHWMVHYLNAGMTDSAEKRALEQAAFESFETGFARRHAAALAAIDGWVGLDYFQIDCAEAPDGRLLLFEVDTASIVHAMDPPDVFPYKPPQMHRVMRAFGEMSRQRAAEVRSVAA